MAFDPGELHVPALYTKTDKAQWLTTFKRYDRRHRPAVVAALFNRAFKLYDKGVLNNAHPDLNQDRLNFYSTVLASTIGLQQIVHDMKLQVTPDDAAGLGRLDSIHGLLKKIAQRKSGKPEQDIWAQIAGKWKGVMEHDRFEAFMEGVGWSFNGTGKPDQFFAQWTASFEDDDGIEPIPEFDSDQTPKHENDELS